MAYKPYLWSYAAPASAHNPNQGQYKNIIIDKLLEGQCWGQEACIEQRDLALEMEKLRLQAMQSALGADVGGTGVPGWVFLMGGGILVVTLGVVVVRAIGKARKK